MVARARRKNRTIISLYAELHRTCVYEVLDHKYLMRGHTFVPNNTDFGQIKKRKKSASVPPRRLVQSGYGGKPAQIVPRPRDETAALKRLDVLPNNNNNNHFIRAQTYIQ